MLSRHAHALKDGGHGDIIRKVQAFTSRKIQCIAEEIKWLNKYHTTHKPSRLHHAKDLNVTLPRSCIIIKYTPSVKIFADNNDKPTFRDVMSNLISIKSLIEGIERRLSKLEVLVVKVASLEESHYFISNKYEDQQNNLNKLISQNQSLEKENTFLMKKIYLL